MSLSDDLHAILDDPFSGEDLSYETSGESLRMIKGLINRSPTLLESIGGSQIPETVYLVTVSNDAVKGIPSPLIGKDKLHFKKALRDSVTTAFRIVSIQSEDAGSFTLQVVK